jgi:hypothetical protein
MHGLQISSGRSYEGGLGSALNEVEAYDYQLATADQYGLTQDEIRLIENDRSALHGVFFLQKPRSVQPMESMSQQIYPLITHIKAHTMVWITTILLPVHI